MRQELRDVVLFAAHNLLKDPPFSRLDIVSCRNLMIYLNQQAQIASLQASQAAQRQRIKNLSDESAKWNDPEYVTAQARSRLQMVKPGDVAYLIIDAGAPSTPSSDPDAGRAKDTGPWYGQLWSSVQAADKPRAR